MNKITIVGPLNVDYKSKINLSVNEALQTFPTPYIKGGISKNIGGKGFLAAKAALAAGMEPHLVACIGGENLPDEEGRFLLQELESLKIMGNIKTCDGYKTAKVSLIYFRDNNPRLMICDNDVIFQLLLSMDEIDNMLNFSSIVFVSGYMLLEQPAQNTIIKLLETAKKRNIFIILDLVPHNIYDYVSIDNLHQVINLTNALIIAPVTLFKLFPQNSMMSSLTQDQLSFYFQKLKVRHLLAVLDKIHGQLIMYDGNSMTTIKFEQIASDAPASGKGECVIFQECSRYFSGGGTDAAH